MLLVTYDPRDTRSSKKAQPNAITPPVGERRREELGKFLKTRRARLSPEDFGMPAGSRRRTPGLRREEVALLAGVGITWYTWLEQGRSINASTQVLDAVARTLRLDQAEREHLYRLAEATPLRIGANPSCVPDELKQVLASLTEQPAVVMNARMDVFESNDAHRAVFRDWHEMPCVHRNLLWCAVTEPSARKKFLNYEPEVRYMVARLRTGYGQYVGDPEWEEDIARLARMSPEFAELWERHEVAESQPRTRIFVHCDAGTLSFTWTELIAPGAGDLRLAVYTPQNEATRTGMRELCFATGER
jgi:transcriptional regulator with XRE-family HTH domain